MKKIGQTARPKFYYVDSPLYVSDYIKKRNNDEIILIDLSHTNTLKPQQKSRKVSLELCSLREQMFR